MPNGLFRTLALALFTVLVGSAPMMGQTISMAFSGTGNSGSGGAINGSGTGTLTPGGAAAISFTGNASNDNCTNNIQFSFKVLIDTSNSVNVFFNGLVPSGVGGGSSGSSGTLNGTLTITGGTGAYAGKGGTGTAAIAVVLSSKTFTFNMTGSLTLAGSVIPVATVNPSGIVPVYTDTPVVQPGSWISIYGNNLANATAIWNGDFPTTLGNVTVTINNKPAYFWFVSAGQINLQAPDDTASGCVPVVVNTPNGTVTTAVDLESISPSFSLEPNSTYAAAVILTPNGSGAYGGGTYDLAGPVGAFSFKTRPAKKGENVVLYGVGFGPTSPSVPAGKVFGSSAKTTNTVQIFLGNSSGTFVPAPVAFSGLIGAGLYQINITIPQNAPSGDLLVQTNVGGSPGTGLNGVQNSGDLNVLLSVQ